MRNHHDPWFRDDSMRYERECAAVGMIPHPLVPEPAKLTIGELLKDFEPGETFMTLGRTTYPELRANPFVAGPPLTEALMRRVCGLDR